MLETSSRTPTRSRRALLGALLAAVLLVSVGCGDTETATLPSTTSKPVRTTTTTPDVSMSTIPEIVDQAPVTAAPPTTAAPTTTAPAPTTAAPVRSANCPAAGTVSPYEQAARCLYDAWQRGDRQAAAAFAEPAAVDDMFSFQRSPWEFNGCSEGYDDSYLGWGCAYVASNAAADFQVGIGFTFVAYDDAIVVKRVEGAGE